MSYVYLLKSLKDNKNYIGSTINYIKRVKQHNKGEVKSTRYRKPLVLVGYQECQSIKEAVKLEKKYKRSKDALLRAIKRKEFILTGRSSIG